MGAFWPYWHALLDLLVLTILPLERVECLGSTVYRFVRVTQQIRLQRIGGRTKKVLVTISYY